MADDAEEAPGTSGGRSKADLIAENPFGVLLMDTDELKAHRTKLKAKPAGTFSAAFLSPSLLLRTALSTDRRGLMISITAGNKLGVQLTGKRGNRTLNQARKKKVLLEKALAFTERNEAKADKLLNRKKGKLALKQLY